MIQLLDVTTSFVVQAEITFNLLTNHVLEKASAEWTFIINSDTSFKEELARKAGLLKRVISNEQETKDDTEDINKYRGDDIYPYTPNVEENLVKLYDSSKISSRSLSALCRKRKCRDIYKMNPSDKINSELINIPHCSIVGPQQYGKAKQFLDFSSIPSTSQHMNDVDPSNGFNQMVHESYEEDCYAVDKVTTNNKKTVLITPVKSNNLISVGYNVLLTQPCRLATEKIDEYEQNDKVEKNVSLQNKNVNINVEIVSKVMTDSNCIIANNEDKKDNAIEIDVIVNNTALIESSNNNIVEISEIVKDRSNICSKENINDNDMVVARNDDNDMDT